MNAIERREVIDYRSRLSLSFMRRPDLFNIGQVEVGQRVSKVKHPRSRMKKVFCTYFESVTAQTDKSNSISFQIAYPISWTYLPSSSSLFVPSTILLETDYSLFDFSMCITQLPKVPNRFSEPLCSTQKAKLTDMFQPLFSAISQMTTYWAHAQQSRSRL